jgi:hypothetical protein
VWAVVSDYYLDARGSGFDQAKWTTLRNEYLAQTLPTHEAAYRCTQRQALALHLFWCQPSRSDCMSVRLQLRPAPD